SSTGGHLDPQPQQGRGEHLALRVGLEGNGPTPVQGAMQEEIEGPQVGQLKALDRSRDDALEMALDPRGGHFPDQHGIVLRLPGDKADVGGIALVAGARMGDVRQWYQHCLASLLHTRTRSTDAVTSRL